MSAYDNIPYPMYLSEDMYPDHLAVKAWFQGIQAPPPNASRVLELGCGAGWSLMAFGYALPGTQFYGIDLCEPDIRRGQEWVDRLGLKNVHLRSGDVMEVGEADGQFDYIVAHGLFSWVPDFVRDHILAICRDRLAPNGVAYLSFNALPGGHIRLMLREMLLIHTRAQTSDAARIEMAYQLIDMLTKPPTPESVYHQALAKAAERFANQPRQQILFDELGPNNRHYYFHEFAALLAQHQLDYVDDAGFADPVAGLAPHAQEVFARMPDRIAREQYLDFFHGRGFRSALVCHRGARRGWKAAAPMAAGLHFAGPATLAGPGDEPGEQRWLGLGSGVITISGATTQRVFARLGEVWPRPIAGVDLMESAGAEAEELAVTLYNAVNAGILRAYVHPPACIRVPGERPRASALARAQADQGSWSTLACDAVKVGGTGEEVLRKLLPLLDGTRTRAELAAIAGHSEAEIEDMLTQLVKMEVMEA
ncbi:MAG: class I SAM-dependent methyltransferase [Bryobacterales bacterium]|nr:class I SAM-dependent methyltransferase [Bryobacterales bacterium]